jgi:uncharacterized protein YbjT (DUF2867 family)
MKVCMVGISGNLGSYMVQHALDRGYEIVGAAANAVSESSTIAKSSAKPLPAATACVLTVLVPWRAAVGRNNPIVSEIVWGASPRSRPS